jgi:hypothetical protein
LDVIFYARVSLKGCNADEFEELTGCNGSGFDLQIRALENLLDEEVSCFPAVMSAFSSRSSCPGFQLVFFNTQSYFYLAEALEYIDVWKQATPFRPTGIFWPIDSTEQMPWWSKLKIYWKSTFPMFISVGWMNDWLLTKKCMSHIHFLLPQFFDTIEFAKLLKGE